LVQRPALAYRSRRVLDVNSTDLAKIEVRHGTDSFTLEQAKGSWHLVTPVEAPVDASKAGQLAGDLSRLEAVEYVTDSATADQLERDGQPWKITGHFEATAATNVAQPLVDELAYLRGERYVAHPAQDLAAYGLEKPCLRVTLPGAPKEGSQDEAKEHVLLSGKPTDKEA